MAIPYRFDDSNTERSSALASAAIGLTQSVLAARAKAARGDASIGLVGGIGDPTMTSSNPMQIDGPQPAYTQPNPPASTTTPVPTGHLDFMGVSTKPANYVQPNTGNPAPHAAGTTSAKNPMGC